MLIGTGLLIFLAASLALYTGAVTLLPLFNR